MNFRRPFQLITPTLDGDVLSALAGTQGGLTGREVARLLGLKSHEGVRRVLIRLADQGIVLAEPVGRAIRYRLNRDHLAAASVEAIAALPAELVQRLRGQIGEWLAPPALAVLFGSAARGEAAPGSDLDLLVIRSRSTDADDQRWREQLVELEAAATRWTGNDTRVLEYAEEELEAIAGREPVLRAAAEEGIELHGSLHALRRAARTGERR